MSAAHAPAYPQSPPMDTIPRSNILYRVPVNREVLIKDYFKFMDGIVRRYDTLTPYLLSEHLIVRANPWIIDTLQSTDYYYKKKNGIFVYDQRELPVLHKGDTLLIPDSIYACAILDQLAIARLDINIPEFKLRIIEGDSILYTIPIRVGQPKKRYQQVVGRVVDLRTQTGKGYIYHINRIPTVFEDPHTGKVYKTTLRDDGKRTLNPLIPWLEPEINGVRYGQLIHPTTNPATLNKAYSNGCMGCSEADAWRIYYYSPVGTQVNIRYDLDVLSPEGDTLHLKDIYNWKKKKKY